MEGEGGEGKDRGALRSWRAAVCAERMAAAIEKSPSGGWEEKTAPHDLPASGADYPYLKTVCRGRRPPLTPPDLIPPPSRLSRYAPLTRQPNSMNLVGFCSVPKRKSRFDFEFTHTVDEDPEGAKGAFTPLPPNQRSVYCVIFLISYNIPGGETLCTIYSISV